MTLTESNKGMPVPSAPAFFYAALITGALAVMVASLPVPAIAQQARPLAAPTIDAPASMRPVPGQLEMSQLIWSTMLAVEHANRSGNYSVLRQLGSQGFQIGNSPAQLAQAFSGLRRTNLDLSITLLVPPTYTEAPSVLQDGVFRARGIFQLRPRAIGFDLYYQWEEGRWKIYGIDIVPLSMVEQR